MMDLPAPEALNALSDDGFVEAAAPLFEGAPRFLRRLAGARPFASDEALSRNSRFFYVVLPSIFGGAGHIDAYRVGSGGSLTLIDTTPSNLPPGVSGLAAS